MTQLSEHLLLVLHTQSTNARREAGNVVPDAVNQRKITIAIGS